MYNDLKKLKTIKGLTDAVKRKIEKAWTWGLISDEQFEELMEIQKTDNGENIDGSIDNTTDSIESAENFIE